jgi:hypothetical protein
LNIYPSKAIVEKTLPSSRVLLSAKIKIIQDIIEPALKYKAEHIYLIVKYLPNTLIS